jgi:Protein of unknown function (DUF1091)
MRIWVVKLDNSIMKVVFKVFLVIFILSQSSAKDRFTTGTRFRAVECIGDNETISFDYCNVKAFSKISTVVNIAFNFLKEVQKPFYIQIIYSYRFGNIYRSMIDSKPIEFCAIMSGFSTNPILKLVTDQLLQAVPNVLHKCPYEKGPMVIQNLTTLNELSNIFPRGLYRFELKLFKNTKEIANIKTFFEVKGQIQSW